MIENKLIKKSPILFSNQKVYKTGEVVGNRALRAEDVVSSFVVVDGITYNTDEASMDRLDRVITIAGYKFHQALANGMSPAEAYSTVYSTAISWKSYDNLFVQVPISTLAAIQEEALNTLNTIWARYN